MSSLAALIAGLLIFIGGHLVSRASALRARLVARFGANLFLGLYSLVALLGLALIAYGFARYRAAGYIDIWTPPRWMPHLVIPLVWAAFVLLAATYLPAGRIKTWARHPMLLAVKIWATAHLLANGDLGSILLFGAFLAWAVFARIALKRAGSGVMVEPVSRSSDLIAILIGSAATAAFVLYLHRILIGVPVLAG